MSSGANEDEAPTHLTAVTEEGASSEHFFRSPKYLTVSAQLHLEALAQSVGKVWTLSPTFRAEKSDTPRHLSEFYMLEAELSYVNNLDQIMDVVEAMLRNIASNLQDTKTVQELCEAKSDELQLMKRWQGLVNGPWPRVTYANAITSLNNAVEQGKAIFEHKPGLGVGLQAEHEKYLAENLGHGGPVFITHYPRSAKPFYMSPSGHLPDSTDNIETVACFDLLVPELCEIVGGSMREHRSAQLLDAMRQNGLVKEKDAAENASETSDSSGSSGTLQWYVDLRRYGSVPHGGFGLGFDRLVSYLSGVPNIRDVVAFPRWYGRCDC